ncbi:MAG TPA: hypothetical protein VF714_09755, partial [Jatrophihabitans sp.]
LVWAANFGALEWHAWTSLTDRPHQPSYALIDIDPGGSTSWQDVLVLARLHRTAFEHLQVLAVPKVTGRRGIQIWVPISRGPSFAETRRWVEQLSKTVGAVVPELLSWKWGVQDRGGKARLDYTQNAINKTLVAPYSARPAPGAPVSMPISWDELDDPELRPDGFAMRTVVQRIADRGDLFRPLLNADQRLPALSSLPLSRPPVPKALCTKPVLQAWYYPSLAAQAWCLHTDAAGPASRGRPGRAGWCWTQRDQVNRHPSTAASNRFCSARSRALMVKVIFVPSSAAPRNATRRLTLMSAC